MFNKPLLLDISNNEKLESVKEMEKVFRVDIGGTWLYSFGMINYNKEDSPVKVYARVRYNENKTKESVDNFADKFPYLKKSDSNMYYILDASSVISEATAVHVKTKGSVANYKEYLVQTLINDLEHGQFELYLSFKTYSGDPSVMKLLKKLAKKVNKVLK